MLALTWGSLVEKKMKRELILADYMDITIFVPADYSIFSLLPLC